MYPFIYIIYNLIGFIDIANVKTYKKKTLIDGNVFICITYFDILHCLLKILFMMIEQCISHSVSYDASSCLYTCMCFSTVFIYIYIYFSNRLFLKTNFIFIFKTCRNRMQSKCAVTTCNPNAQKPHAIQMHKNCIKSKCAETACNQNAQTLHKIQMCINRMQSKCAGLTFIRLS